MNMVDAAQVLESAIRSFPEAEARLRVNQREIIEPVVCSTFEFRRAASDMGPFDEAPIKIRLPEAAETEKTPLTRGSVIEIARPDSDEWTRLRIVARRTIAGLLVLTMENPDE